MGGTGIGKEFRDVMFNHFHNIEQSDSFVDIPEEIRNALPKLPLDLRQVKALKYKEAVV